MTNEITKGAKEAIKGHAQFQAQEAFFGKPLDTIEYGEKDANGGVEVKATITTKNGVVEAAVKINADILAKAENEITTRVFVSDQITSAMNRELMRQLLDV